MRRRLDEVAEQGETDIAALLRVELRRPHRPPLDRGREAPAVVAPRGDVTFIGGIGRERVHEIAPRGIGQSGDEPRFRVALQRVPAHLREPDRVGEPRDAARDDPEAVDAGRLVTAVEQHLHSHADTEERTTIGRRGTRLGFEPAVAQRPHARAEVADARQHHRVGRADLLGIGREVRVGTEVLERLLRRAQVPDPVIDDRDHQPDNVPLVDGTSLPSTFTASRSARATPLNDASITW